MCVFTFERIKANGMIWRIITFTLQLSNLTLKQNIVAQLVKNLPAMQEMWVQSLSWEDPLERERLHTPVFRPGEFHGLYSPWGRKESDTTEWLSLTRYANITTLSISLKIKRKCINATVSQNVINYSQTFVFWFCFWRLNNVLFRNVSIIVC